MSGGRPSPPLLGMCTDVAAGLAPQAWSCQAGVALLQPRAPPRQVLAGPSLPGRVRVPRPQQGEASRASGLRAPGQKSGPGSPGSLLGFLVLPRGRRRSPPGPPAARQAPPGSSWEHPPALSGLPRGWPVASLGTQPSAGRPARGDRGGGPGRRGPDSPPRPAPPGTSPTTQRPASCGREGPLEQTGAGGAEPYLPREGMRRGEDPREPGRQPRPLGEPRPLSRALLGGAGPAWGLTRLRSGTCGSAARALPGAPRPQPVDPRGRLHTCALRRGGGCAGPQEAAEPRGPCTCTCTCAASASEPWLAAALGPPCAPSRVHLLRGVGGGERGGGPGRPRAATRRDSDCGRAGVRSCRGAPAGDEGARGRRAPRSICAFLGLARGPQDQTASITPFRPSQGLKGLEKDFFPMLFVCIKSFFPFFFFFLQNLSQFGFGEFHTPPQPTRCPSPPRRPQPRSPPAPCTLLPCRCSDTGSGDSPKPNSGRFWKRKK